MLQIRTTGISLIFSVTVAVISDLAAAPALVDPNLDVRTVTTGLSRPTTMAFLNANHALVLEKNTGIVKHLVKQPNNTFITVGNIAIDLAVNGADERGLLGIAVDPDFNAAPPKKYVYLYWTCKAPLPTNPFVPALTQCANTPELGTDASDSLAVPLLGNRVDRFVWNPQNGRLAFNRNLIKLRVFQNDGAPTPSGQGDEGQPPAASHNGGAIKFGPDKKLYIIIGDVGRRSQLQNLPSGPTATGSGPTVPDDQFGGPQPDNAHFTGVILRLNRDGTAVSNNPFFQTGANRGGVVGANIQKIFAYGFRNGFGMDFDPLNGKLWMSENGNGTFDELNLVTRGMNSGWIQIMGPSNRLAEYKANESSLGQARWPPSRIADSAAQAKARLFKLPGSAYSEPEFSWKFPLAPAAVGFVKSNGLGQALRGALLVGFSNRVMGGPLFKFNLSANRLALQFTSPALADRVADNAARGDLTESESLLFGSGFGVVTDIQTGPNGNVFVVSLSNGAIYEILRK